MLRTIFAVLILAYLAFGQANPVVRNDAGNPEITPQIKTYSAGDLPTVAAGTIIRVDDADGDCETDSGSDVLYCEYDGATWNIWSGGNGGGGGGMAPPTYGPYASRPACSGTAPSHYYVTDLRGVADVCDGSAWQRVVNNEVRIGIPPSTGWTDQGNTTGSFRAEGWEIIYTSDSNRYGGSFRPLPTPGAGGLRITAQIMNSHRAPASWCGIGVTDGFDITDNHRLWMTNHGVVLGAATQTWAGTTTPADFSYLNVSSLGAGVSVVTWRYTEDATHRIIELLDNNGNWQTVQTQTKSTGLTATHFGPMCRLSGAASQYVVGWLEEALP